ncbi:MAG: Rho termination factor N-terminal domain-containing protein [Desulfobacterales bacterium]|jgi:signal recognition particle subunit SEC65|nr:Rho termination protein [Desulfobacter sp.]MDP6394577.1 Rho termination factor N-terminal domain-containing protein [Desulfobacterales bacterium]MDP6683736.1 Rho termination factor N-terminal domain-containing protein [Desulfobacterales bacterium]MDP6806125.1 Rho termination factor N-terminal domain-containing protein [Desulfobacterales bacterium]|tara:strand:- start:17369 stop:17695 length:327 start_codon:yes stop_codon:yes gene_type:complete
MDEKKEQSKEKPLENMTVKELREIAKEMPEITGVHGKNKAELFNAVRKARGIIDKTPKKKDSTVQGIKQRIRELKTKRMAAAESHDKKMVSIYRRRISRLKKRTRKAA